MIKVKNTTYQITKADGSRTMEITLCTTSEKKFIDAYQRLAQDYPEQEGYQIKYLKETFETIN